MSAAACGSPSDKKADATSGVVDTIVAPDVTQPAPSSTAVPTAPAATSTTRAPATTATSAASASIVLAPDGIGVARFGDRADVVVTRLRAKLGAPRSDGPPDGPCDPKVTRTVYWDGFSVHLGTTFVGYHRGGPKHEGRFTTAAGIGSASTIGQLKAAYPSKVTLDPGDVVTNFSVSLPTGTISGTASASEDGDFVYDLFAGAACGS